MAPTRNNSPKPDNHVIVLFGATGDLARRKLLPGFFHLHAAGLLPKEYRIIGVSPHNAALTTEQFREHAEQACTDFCITKPTDPSWPSFAERVSFAAADPDNTTDLVEAVERAEKEIGGPVRRLYHLAVPPAAFTSVVRMLGATGLATGARVIRSQANTLRTREFVTSAVFSGERLPDSMASFMISMAPGASPARDGRRWGCCRWSPSGRPTWG